MKTFLYSFVHILLVKTSKVWEFIISHYQLWKKRHGQSEVNTGLAYFVLLINSLLCENNVHLFILLCYWLYVVFLPWQGLNVWVFFSLFFFLHAVPVSAVSPVWPYEFFACTQWETAPVLSSSHLWLIAFSAQCSSQPGLCLELMAGLWRF